MKEFKSYNPYVILLHFVFVVAVAMFFMHPVILLVAFLSGVVNLATLSGINSAVKKIFLLIPVVVITAVINPLFNHSGVTVLGYFPGGNPLTLEAIIYGAFSGIMLGAVVVWFFCFNEIFKSDKILYVFGKIAPSLALVLSMSMRFVPRFVKRSQEVIKAQSTLGYTIEKGSVKKRIKTASGVLSSVVGWALENSVETAQSMRARGFSSKKRTTFSVYTFDSRDKILLFALIVSVVMFLASLKMLCFSYYPVYEFSVGVSGILVYTVTCFMPVLIDFAEGKRWN